MSSSQHSHKQYALPDLAGDVALEILSNSCRYLTKPGYKQKFTTKDKIPLKLAPRKQSKGDF